MPERFKKLLRRLQLYSDRWWYVPLMALLVFLDLFIVIIPSEALLVKTILLKHKRWLYAPFIMAFASAVGATLLAYLTQEYGEKFLLWLNPSLFTEPKWDSMRAFIDDKGAVALALIAISPLPQQPAIALCGLAHMNLWTLFLAVFLGRAPKYYLFGWLAKQSPRYFQKLFPGAFDDAKKI